MMLYIGSFMSQSTSSSISRLLSPKSDETLKALRFGGFILPFLSLAALPTFNTTSMPIKSQITEFSKLPITAERKPTYVSLSSFLLKKKGLVIMFCFGLLSM